MKGSGKKNVEIFRVEGVEIDLSSLKMKVDVSATMSREDVVAVISGVTSVAVQVLLTRVLQSLLKRIEK